MNLTNDVGKMLIKLEDNAIKVGHLDNCNAKKIRR